MHYKYITETFFLMDNKHRKFFVMKQSKGCIFTPKKRQNTFGGRALPGPAGGVREREEGEEAYL